MQPEKSPTGEKNQRRVRRSFTWAEIEWPVVIGVGGVSILLGTLGFYRYSSLHAQPVDWLDAFYQALQLFPMNSGALVPPLPWELQAARLLAPLTAAYALIQAFLVIFRDQVDLVRLRRAHGHVIICGMGRKGLLLAGEYIHAGERVVVVEKDASNSSLNIARELGAMVIVEDARQPYVLNKAGVQRARLLVAVCGEDGTNAEIALQARQLVRGRSKPDLECIIHIWDPQLWTLLRQWEFKDDPDDSIRFEFFNVFENGARLLLEEAKFLAEDVVEKPPCLLIIGFGYLGERLVLQAARAWSRVYSDTGWKLHIKVMDPNVDRLLTALQLRYPLVRDVCDFDSHPFDTNSAEFAAGGLFMDSGGENCVTHVFICVDDISTGLSSGLSILERLRGYPVQILVRMSEDGGLAGLLREARGGSNGGTDLRAFCLLNCTCKPEQLEDGTHKILAQAIHAVYYETALKQGEKAGSKPSLVAWDALPEAFKQSNLEQADHLLTKLTAVGCWLAPWTRLHAGDFEFTPQEVEKLAAMEHARFLAERQRAGWKYGEEYDEVRKTSPALLPYEDLRLREGERDKDRNSVRLIPRYLARAGFQIERIRDL